MPVQVCTLPLPTPLLPLWAVRPVQSLSAGTRVHFTFTCTSKPLWAVRPVQSLSASTRVHFTFTCTSTPLWAVRPVQSLSACTTVHLYLYLYLYSPMGRTACTEPQCLYNGALYLYLYLYSPMGRTACTEPQCLYKGALYLYLYLYSPCRLYGLYRASVPVQRCTFTFTYTSTPPMGRTVHRGSRGIGKGKVHCCTGTEALYRPYGP